jgi:hypothetical protein
MAGRGRENADGALATALAGGATVADAAKRAGVSERTAFRRLQNLDFRLRVNATQSAITNRTIKRLVEASESAADALLVLLVPQSPPAVRLGAAKAILQLVLRERDSAEFRERLASIENKLASFQLSKEVEIRGHVNGRLSHSNGFANRLAASTC